MQTNKKKGLTVKDLVTIGIFSALFLVFALVGGIFFAPNPVPFICLWEVHCCVDLSIF